MSKVYILARIDTNKGFNPEYANAFIHKRDAINQMVIEFLETRKKPEYEEEYAICDGDSYAYIGSYLYWVIFETEIKKSK